MKATTSAAFTLFELLAVLTIISVGLMMIVGSYGMWGSSHALDGAARTLEAGLLQARTLAMAQNTYVAFDYGTTNPPNTALSSTTGFQSFFCTNAVPPVSDEDLQTFVSQFSDQGRFIPSDGTRSVIAGSELILEPAAPFQRLSGHVYLPGPQLLFFRPDGSVIFDEDLFPDEHAPLLYLSLLDGPNTVRILRVDPTTGLVTVLTDGGTAP